MSDQINARSVCSAICLLCGVASGSYADDSGASRERVALEEIVVTAQKREQSLQDVPISVSAVTGAELEIQNRNEIFDLAKMVAGFSFKAGASDNDKAIQIRGVGTATFSRGVEQTVGTTVDGVVSSATVASFLDFDDVERVEVLRGPQGMLFGKNASAGLLNITTKRPTEEFSAGLSGSYAEENEIKTSGYISGPLLDDALLGRLSYYSNSRDPIIENVAPTGPDYNDRDEWGVKAKLLYQPTDELEFYFSYSHSERDHNCCARPIASLDTSHPLAAVFLAAGVPSGSENDRLFEVNASTGITEVDVYSLDINYHIGDHTLTSVTSFTETEREGEALGAGFPFTFAPINRSDAEISQITQELRLTSPSDQTVSYVAGLYYYKNELDRDFLRVQDLSVLGSPSFLSTSNDNQVDSESYAIFGQATWNINDITRLSLGLRYNHEDIRLRQMVAPQPLPANIANPGGLPVFPEATPGTIDVSETDEAVSWRVIAERNILEDAMVYASIARGYKGPGGNTLFSGVTAEKPIVDAEVPTNYELGIKSEWLDGKVRVNTSVFRTDFKDFQASLSDGQIPVSFFLDNAGELRTEGVEVEVFAQATENLFLSANIAFIDAAFEEYEGAACYPGQTVAQGCVDGSQDLSGKDLPFSPDLVVNLFTRYDINLESLPFDMYLQGSYHWQDEVQHETNNDPRTIADSYGIADFAVGIESETGSYSAQLFVKNVFDEFYVSGLTSAAAGLGVDLLHSLEYDYTRRIGVSFKLNF